MIDDIAESNVSGSPVNRLLEKGIEYLEPVAWVREAAKRGLVEMIGDPIPQGEAELAYVTVRKKDFEWMGLLRNYNLRICMTQEDAERLEADGLVKINKRFTGDLSKVTR